MNGFERLKKQKRTAILLAAEKLFLQHGIKKVSIKTIAAAAGVSQVTIYNHYHGKNELVEIVVENIINKLITQYQEVINSPNSFMIKLELILKLRIKAISNGSWYLLSAAAADINIRQKIEHSLGIMLKKINHRLVQQGKKEKIINPAIESETIEQYIEMFRNWFDESKTAATNEKKANEFLQLFLYGIRGKMRSD